MIFPEQHIKCIFRNGTIIEGIVEEWGPTRYHLRSLSDQSLMIIMRPEDDILLIKVMPDPEEEIVEELPKKTSTPPAPIQEQIRTKLKEVEGPAEDLNLQEKTVEELRKLAIEQERQILVEKMKEHFPSGSKRSNYSSQAYVLDRKSHGKS